MHLLKISRHFTTKKPIPISFSQKNKLFLPKIIKNFSSLRTNITTKLLDKINLEKINKHKNAVLFENDNSQLKIIFPDFKVNIDLRLFDDTINISQLIEKSVKALEKERVLTLSFIDEEGLEISGSVKASMLYRLEKFKISINRGEKVYTCYNFNFLANQKLSQTTDIPNHEFFEKIEKDMDKYKLPFHISYIVNKNSGYCNNKEDFSSKLSFKTIFKNILYNKYYPLQSFKEQNNLEKDRRVWKMLNLFFYLTLMQTVTLNMCVFVFFNWDIMEPITQCITFLNIICGYYFWAYSNGGDYEISSIASWLKTRTFFFRNINNALNEKNQIEEFLEKRKNE